MEAEMWKAILTFIVGLLTIAVNIGITWYNRGKNRVTYEVKVVLIQGDKIESLNSLLKDGKYTILFAGQDISNIRMTRYVLGRVK